MKPLKTLRRLFVVLLFLKSLTGFTQTPCDQASSYLEHFEYGTPNFLQLYTGGYCISDSISDTTIYMRFYPNNENGIVYWGYSSPLGFSLNVANVAIYNSSCILISQGRFINDLTDQLYYIRFDLRTEYIDNFCPYFVPYNPLAVDFGMIKAERHNSNIFVDWVTMSEENSNYFVVEYSYDLNNWIEATSVKAGGNSSTQQFYSAEFKPIYSGIVYIRIVEYDYNGNTTKSDPIYIEYNLDTIYNRPVYDLAGRLIKIRN